MYGEYPISETMLATMQLNGFRLFKNDLLEYNERKQYRFPRSKKRRIRNKWRKNNANWKDHLISNLVKNGKDIYVGPVAYERLMNQFKQIICKT